MAAFDADHVSELAVVAGDDLEAFHTCHPFSGLSRRGPPTHLGLRCNGNGATFFVVAG
jgi:hypothetical protein